MKEVVLDTETTGLSVSMGHRLVEVACVELEDQIPTNNFFHKYINPERKVSSDAQRVHGYSDEFLADKEKFSEIADDLLKFIKDKRLVIHNAPFDLSFLNNELKILNKGSITENVVDTLELAKIKFPNSSNSLDALCKRYKIDNTKREKHSAILDCQLLTKVYVNLIEQKEPKFNFNTQKILNKEKVKLNNNLDYSKKVILPNKDEILAHKIFLKKELKKNFFK
ncbi:MAG: DNA polymerase III subunit epsilon [Candidatus Pelagibacter sp. TMED64]|nr:DNA polymerase III subunit epsilon [Candidatus Pelagibacter sp.]OUU65541.1 MAG: DNA polymerase III subunit epsilon [Candidatus Pelagibacter sp. TMED64]|tara:strand:+ start:21958 stop:22629 length:672 start_codon:yes stop_codon:yes gene_type:complete